MYGDKIDHPIWTIWEPDPHLSDLAYWNDRLRFGGYESDLPRLRAVWAGTLAVVADGQRQAQYAYPWSVEVDCAVVRCVKDGDSFRVPAKDDPESEVLDYELPIDETLWPPELRRQEFIRGIKTYYVQEALPVYAIQELVPGRFATLNRDDTLLDATNGLYRLAEWCGAPFDTAEKRDLCPWGETRPIVDSDIASLKARWDERLHASSVRPDEPMPARMSQKRFAETMGVITGRRKAAEKAVAQSYIERGAAFVARTAGVQAAAHTRDALRRQYDIMFGED